MPTIESERQREEELSSTRLLRDDTKQAAGKIAVFQYIVVAVFVFLISGFWKLQVQNPDVYSEAAVRNRIKSTPILAPRGKILDREGRVIVDNKASYSLLLNRDQIKWEHLPFIADALHLDYTELANKLRHLSRPQIIIKEQLTRDEIAWVESHRDASAYPEMETITAWRRQYPQDGFAAHISGYVGEISESELDQPAFLDYHQGDIIGKDGVERQYDSTLRGVDGQRRVLVDNMGRERQLEVTTQAASAGKDLRLTIDLDLQAVAELAMDGKRGAVVALNPQNGEVLALVSRPAYDPNRFTARISRAVWQDIAGNPDKPLLNRAIQAQLAPGSTFKPIMAIAGLESEVMDPDTTFHCAGGAMFYGHPFACHLKGGHGTISLHRAIAQSCDVYFYNVGNRLGIDRIAHYAELAGVGHRTGIDLPNETQGTMPSTKWKMRLARQKWYAGETISVAIGQGAVTVSPLQIASALGGLGAGGIWYKPRLVSTNPPEVLRRGNFNTEHLEDVISGMYGVVNEGGTGRAAQLQNVKICGKTGTAQLAATEKVKLLSKGNKYLGNNAWFVAFGPMEKPEIVVAALYENGIESYNAVPIVRDILKAYFDKKARQSAALFAASHAPPPPPSLWQSLQHATALLTFPEVPAVGRP